MVELGERLERNTQTMVTLTKRAERNTSNMTALTVLIVIIAIGQVVAALAAVYG